MTLTAAAVTDAAHKTLTDALNANPAVVAARTRYDTALHAFQAARVAIANEDRALTGYDANPTRENLADYAAAAEHAAETASTLAHAWHDLDNTANRAAASLLQ